MSQETVPFPYVVNGVAQSLAVAMVSGRVVVKPVAEAMGLRWDRVKDDISRGYPVVLEKVGRHTAATLTVDDLEKWLTALAAAKTSDPDRVKHFQNHLGPTLRRGSVGLLAEIARQRVEKDKRDAEKAAQIVEVCEPLASPDFMRKDLSLGFKRMAPDAIAYTVNMGVLDLFIREESFWGDGADEVRHVQVASDNYREKLLGDMRVGSVELLTGPQAVANHLKLPALERKMIPAAKVIDARGDKPRLVTVPAHLSLFPWERAILQGTKNARDIELPGSPYHRQRPSWIDL